MSEFSVHTIESAPEKSSKLLTAAKANYGFVPNLLGVLAESPATLEAYMTLGKIFEQSSFSAVERQVIILAVSRVNECRYCVAAHSVIAGMHKVPGEIVAAVRKNQAIDDPRLEALRKFATAAVEKRGWLGKSDLAEFAAAGFKSEQVLEIILAISFKTISNYANHVADTPLDEAFTGAKWQPGE